MLCVFYADRGRAEVTIPEACGIHCPGDQSGKGTAPNKGAGTIQPCIPHRLAGNIDNVIYVEIKKWFSL